MPTVTRASLSCRAIQAQCNELFGAIIKLIFVKTFRKFQSHCCRRFSRDVQLQRLRVGPRHLLFIILMRAAKRRGGCDGGHSWVCKSNVQNCKASHPPATQKSLASHRDHFTTRMHECAAEKKISEKFQPRLQLVPHTQTAVRHEQGDRYRLSTNVLPGVDIQFVYVKK